MKTLKEYRSEEFELPPTNESIKILILPADSTTFCWTTGYWDGSGWKCPYDNIGYEVLEWRKIN